MRNFESFLTECYQRRLQALDVAEAQARALARDSIQASLTKLDEDWKTTCRIFQARCRPTDPESWRRDVSKIHARRQVAYEEQRANLLARLESKVRPRSLEQIFEQVGDAAKQIEAALYEYGPKLAVKRRQLVQPGEYGELDSGRWLKELQRFMAVNPQIKNALTILGEADAALELHFDWASVLLRALDAEVSPADLPAGVQPGDGLGFERMCAAALTALGWKVDLTPTTGDQGVDLLATRQGRTVAIQCKNFSDPIGNAAVQEVFAGRAFYEAELACVVAPSGFTVSARQLAAKLSVLLLDPTELHSLN